MVFLQSDLIKVVLMILSKQKTVSSEEVRIALEQSGYQAPDREVSIRLADLSRACCLLHVGVENGYAVYSVGSVLRETAQFVIEKADSDYFSVEMLL